MYGISYITRYRNEVKIHNGSCRFTINSSQAGEVKWKYGEDLEQSVLIANDLSSERNSWRYAQCCMRQATYVYKCRNCNKLTQGKRQPKKIGYVIIMLLAILPHLIISLPTGISAGLGPDFNFVQNILVFSGGISIFMVILVLPTYYYAHKKKCSNCKTIDYA